MAEFIVTYYAGGFGHEERMEASDAEAARDAALTKLAAEPRITFVTARGEAGIVFSDRVAAVLVQEAVSADAATLPDSPDEG